METLEHVCRRVPLVLPLHPRTRKSLATHGLSDRLGALPGLTLCEPLGYLDFLQVLSQSLAVITDSGGIQEETTYLRIPCLTMRENTERLVTITTGSNVLVGSNLARLDDELGRVLQGTFKPGGVPELWDGHTAERIATILSENVQATPTAATPRPGGD